MVNCDLYEMKEDSSLNVDIKDIISTYANINICVTYSNVEIRQKFTIVYYRKIKNFDVKLDKESRFHIEEDKTAISGRNICDWNDHDRINEPLK